MSQELRLIALATAMGGDIKVLVNRVGDMTSLQTTAKGNIVAAINELMGLMGSSGAAINDSAGNGATTVTWSADKIYDTIELAKAAVKSDILGGATAAFDTLKELQDLITGDESIVSALATKVGEKVSFAEVQTLTTGQRLQACTNIGIGNPEVDLVAAYTAAKA